MSIDYNNIKDLVKLLYEFVYTNNKEIFDNYEYIKFEPDKINLDDLIKKDIDKQIILASSFGNKENFKFIAKTKNKIILKKYFKDFPLTLVIQKFKKDLEDTTNIIDIYYELFINQLVSELVIVDKIPFYLLNICNFNIDYALLKNNDDYLKLITKEFNLIDQTDSNSKFCFSLYEHYNSYITMQELLNEELSSNDLYNLFFQVLFSYAYINNKFGYFRHGSFNINSFMILKEKYNKLNLNIDKNKFVINNVNFICKLFDYRNSVLSGFKNKTSNIIDINNPSYDIYTFLKSIYDYTLNIKNNKNFEKIKIIISNFISIDLIENKLINEYDFADKYVESIIPIHILLKNNFFSSSINTSIKMSRSISGKNQKNYKLNIESATEDDSKIVGYRMLARNSSVLTGGAKKNSKKISKGKKSSRTKAKSSGKPSKSSKYGRLSREVEVKEEVDNIDTLGDDIFDDSTEVQVDKEKKVIKAHKKTEELEEEEVENQQISPDEENENDEITSEGDDERERTPLDNEDDIPLIDDTEDGKYKKKAFKTKTKSSKSSKPSKSKQNLDSSTTISLDGNDSESEKGNNKSKSKSRSKPKGDKYAKFGKLGEMLKGVNKNGLFAVPGELQGLFNDEQVMAMNQALGDVSDAGDEDFGNGEPQIADAGLSRMFGPGGIPGMGGMGGLSGMSGMGNGTPQITHPALANFGPIGPPPSGPGAMPSLNGLAGMGGLTGMGGLAGMGGLGNMGGLAGMNGMGDSLGSSGLGAGSEYGISKQSMNSNQNIPSVSNQVSSASLNKTSDNLVMPNLNNINSNSTPASAPLSVSASVPASTSTNLNSSIAQAGGAEKKKKIFFLKRN